MQSKQKNYRSNIIIMIIFNYSYHPQQEQLSWNFEYFLTMIQTSF